MATERLPRKAQIIATLGPAQNYNESDRVEPHLNGQPSFDKVAQAHFAGADFFRLNFSHGSHQSHGALYSVIHDVRVKHQRNVGVLADLCGPKLRIGDFQDAKEGIILTPGQLMRFDLNNTPGDNNRVCLPHPEILAALKPGHRLILDDGNVQMQVEESGGVNGSSFVMASVVSGVRLKSRKGINTPDVRLAIPAMTEKDFRDMEFALSLGVDCIALSFVQTADDIIKAKRLIGDRADLIAKIETQEAMNNLPEIIHHSDAIMVARGDLGVELGIDEVPNAQRIIVRASRLAGKPVIVATQMLESMITDPEAKRPEVNDISQAIWQGACATMLSAESASGKYPLRAIKTMSDQIALTEDFIRDPMKYVRQRYKWAAEGLLDPQLPLPPAQPIRTWQHKRDMGLPVLPHLRTESAQQSMQLVA